MTMVLRRDRILVEPTTKILNPCPRPLDSQKNEIASHPHLNCKQTTTKQRSGHS